MIKIIVILFLRIREELKTRIKFFADEEKISVNKMAIKLLELGILNYVKGGMIQNEDDTMQANCK